MVVITKYTNAHNKSLRRTNLSVTPLAKKKYRQPAFAAELSVMHVKEIKHE